MIVSRETSLTVKLNPVSRETQKYKYTTIYCRKPSIIVNISNINAANIRI